MKKLLTMLLVVVFTFSSAFAYSQTELTTKKNSYKTIIQSKIGSKLTRLSEDKLRKIPRLIDVLVKKYKNSLALSDTKKLQKIAVLLAFKEIVNKKLEDEFSDINSILNTVNTKTEIIIINDKRCGSKCDMGHIVNNIKMAAEVEKITVREQDYSNETSMDLLIQTGVKKLPAVFISDKSFAYFDGYLLPTNTPEYYQLNLGIEAIFDPYSEMSEKGFKILDKQILSEIKASSHIKGNKNAEILWLEYSDMECPFCAKLHNNGTLKDLEEKYGDKLAYSLQHFPLGFHKNALPAAHYLECIAKQKGPEVFYKLEDKVFSEENSNEDFLIKTAVSLGVDKVKLQTCVDSKVFSTKITAQQKRGTSVFGVTGTPGNVLINVKTGEYDVINGAYPTASFVEIIDRLLK